MRFPLPAPSTVVGATSLRFAGPGWFRCCALLSLLIAAGTGCQTYQEKNKIITKWELNRFEDAEQEANARVKKSDHTRDGVIWRLEQGAVLRLIGKYKESNDAFDQAEAEINRFEEAAKVKVSDEALALVSNQASRPYEGRTYDKVMVNTYKALNDMWLGDFERARVEMIRTYARQQDAVQANARRIEKAQDAQKPEVSRARNDPQFRNQLDTAYKELNSMRAYADYVNPFSVYLDGLFFAAQAADGSDLERSHKSLERVLEMIGENKFVRQDLEMVDRIMKGQPIAPTTYVLFETGMAPRRGQVRIDIPVFTRYVPYVGAAFPTLEYIHNHLGRITVNAGGQIDSTLPLCSMDSVITKEFRNELPGIITRTIISSLAKAGVTFGAQKAVDTLGRGQGADALGVLAAVAGAVYQLAVNVADTRTWTTLPKEFQLARFATPTDRRMEITSGNAGHKTVVTIGEGTINVIYVKSVTPNGPLVISQVKLK